MHHETIYRKGGITLNILPYHHIIKKKKDKLWCDARNLSKAFILFFLSNGVKFLCDGITAKLRITSGGDVLIR